MTDEIIKAWDDTAHNYFKEVLSPFDKGVENPIFLYIKKIPKARKKTVIDIGTGIGNAVSFLSKEFESVIGIDISPEMVKISKNRFRKLNNVEIIEKDATNLKEFYGKFDVAISVNSILVPETKTIEKILSEIKHILKNHGIFLGIFPSMESILYRALLENERAEKEGLNKKSATKR